MEMLSSAVVGELVNRSISFLVSRFEKETPTATAEDMQRLRHQLLRSGAIVRDAEQRHVPSKAMLLQLKALRDETFRGYYILDVACCRNALRGGDRRRRNGNDEAEDDGGDEVGRRAFSLSRFNPAKRVRFRSGAPETEPVPVDLQQVARSLEVIISDMKEFVMFLGSYPPLYRQPYSAHMFLEKCMFGRHMEKERVIDFLLQTTEPPPGAENLDVLPIVGPAYIGKSTLVEHVCQDEKVRGHFSLILVYSRNCLRDETAAGFRDNCVIKHQNDSALEEKLLIVVELSGDVDDETWERLYSSERGMPHGSKMILTSRSNEIARFGTTQALCLKCLPTEPYWYFFKRLAFGGDDPEQHPKMASIAMEMARKMQGSFMYAHIGSALLRANFSIKSWSMVLTNLREFLQKNMSLLGEEYPDDLKAKDHPQWTWNLTKQKHDEYFMLYEIYPRGSGAEEVPDITMIDLLFGCAQPRGKYEVLFWKSQIPPYFNYICTCETVVCEQ
ncbi:hypothetical protein SETIT_3G167600v2 [Setaria italica]|uniref:NB-ARC domain-containing protein n=1 Tax=Setaria italica TaxID=4555 RepID=A0A368QGE5_SETIT|nr:disease resistance protein RGA2 [Setaria italica]RCV16808.1 hypothetical protein SETIT_3G167600v2 [Setaria italica]